MPSHYVKQLHDQGCAIAAIAMVTGSSYQDVMVRAFPNGYRRLRQRGRAFDLGVTPKNMVRLIRSYGVKARLSRLRPVLRTTSIILFDWFPAADSVNGCHAVVWVPRKRKIMDPGWFKSLGVEFYLSRWIDSGGVAIEIPGRVD